MQISIREQRLPGIGQRYEMDLDETRRLVVITTPDGGRSIGFADGDRDEVPAMGLTREQATMLGALLLGAHFSIDVRDDPAIDADTVLVDTITVPDGAPSIGRRPSDILHSTTDDALILGVIRDRTPDVLEPDRDPPLDAGDRVAIASRADLIEAARRLLTG